MKITVDCSKFKGKSMAIHNIHNEEEIVKPDPKKDISSETYKCFACERSLKKSQWPTTMLRNHRRWKRRLLCMECSTLGLTAKDVRKYRCKDCKRDLGHSMFDKNVLKNYKKRNSPLRCRLCSKKCKCAICGRGFKKKWGHKKRKNLDICHECRENGYTMKNTKTYTCIECKKKTGSNKFDHNSMVLYKNFGKVKPICNECQCRRRTWKREAHLQRMSMQKKKMKSLKMMPRNVDNGNNHEESIAWMTHT